MAFFRSTKLFLKRSLRPFVFQGIVFLMLVVVLTLSQEVYAAPSGINVQIRLRDALGTPFTSSTVVRVSLYGLPSKEVTTSTLNTIPLIWQEIYNGTSVNCPLALPDSQGNLSLNLGSCNSFPNSFKGAVAVGIKIGPEPVKPTLYDALLDDEGVATKRNGWIYSRLIPLAALRGLAQISLKTVDFSFDTALDAIPNSFTSSVSSTVTSTTLIMPDELAAALLSLENRLSAVTSTVVQAGVSSTLALLQNTAVPTLTVAHLTVTESPTFTGNLVVQGVVGFGEDTVGQAEIVTEGREVVVPFTHSYERAPIIVVTPFDYDGLWKVTQVTTTGFAIVVPATSTRNILFSWHAFMPSPSMRVVVGKIEEKDIRTEIQVREPEPVVPPPVVSSSLNVASSTLEVMPSSTPVEAEPPVVLPTEISTTTPEAVVPEPAPVVPSPTPEPPSAEPSVPESTPGETPPPLP